MRACPADDKGRAWTCRCEPVVTRSDSGARSRSSSSAAAAGLEGQPPSVAPSNTRLGTGAMQMKSSVFGASAGVGQGGHRPRGARSRGRVSAVLLALFDVGSPRGGRALSRFSPGPSVPSLRPLNEPACLPLFLRPAPPRPQHFLGSEARRPSSPQPRVRPVLLWPVGRLAAGGESLTGFAPALPLPRSPLPGGRRSAVRLSPRLPAWSNRAVLLADANRPLLPSQASRPNIVYSPQPVLKQTKTRPAGPPFPLSHALSPKPNPKTDGRTRRLPRPRRPPDAHRHPVLRVLALVRAVRRRGCRAVQHLQAGVVPAHAAVDVAAGTPGRVPVPQARDPARPGGLVRGPRPRPHPRHGPPRRRGGRLLCRRPRRGLQVVEALEGLPAPSRALLRCVCARRFPLLVLC